MLSEFKQHGQALCGRSEGLKSFWARNPKGESQQAGEVMGMFLIRGCLVPAAEEPRWNGDGDRSGAIKMLLDFHEVVGNAPTLTITLGLGSDHNLLSATCLDQHFFAEDHRAAS